MIGVGVIGLGVGMHHARTAFAHPECELVVLCDFDEEALKRAGSEYPEAVRAADAADVLTDPAVDLVVVAGYDDTHAEQVVSALEGGKHVFVEKPMCLTRDEALDIAAALRNNPGQLSSNLGLRTCPRFIAARDAIRRGELGDVYHMEGDYLWGRKIKLTAGWRKDIPFYSIIHGAAVHMVDLLVWFAGELPVAVRATGNGIATRGGPLRYNDFAMLCLEFESGMSAKVGAHGGCVHPHAHKVAVYGAEKTFVNDDCGGRWFDSSDPEDRPRADVYEYPAKEERNKVFASFAGAIADPSVSPVVPVKDVFDTMAICFAAEEAMATGREVPINYDYSR